MNEIKLVTRHMPCPHCSLWLATVTKLDQHLRFDCPKLNRDDYSRVVVPAVMATLPGRTAR